MVRYVVLSCLLFFQSLYTAEQVDPLLAVVIMVKNEAAVIEKTLQPYVDAGVQHFLVFDTGSTDATMTVTKAFFERHHIPQGVIKQEAFIDFATSRNRALRLAEEAFPAMTFFLMPDAEWYMNDVPGLLTFCNEQKQKEGDVFGIRLVTPSQAFFMQHRLIRAGSSAKFVYPVHEYTVGNMVGDVPASICFYFRPTSAGDAKSDQRLVRDRDILLKKYEQNPEQETRAAFYLGQTYAGLKEYDEALRWYQRRVAMGGWDEERYVAQYRVGQTYEWLGDWEKALNAYHEAFALRPTRIEPLVRIANHYWQTEQLALCYLYAQRAVQLPMPAQDICFVEQDLYDFDRYNLLSIASWYVGDYQAGKEATLKALSVRPQEEHLRYNLSIYNKALGEEVKPEEKPIVIISVGYNNKNFYKDNLDSTLFQHYKNYRIIYVDADSPDGTFELVKAYVKEKGMEHKITLIKNETRCGSAENIYNAIQLCKPDEIIVMCEADDQLAHSNVLKKVNEVYQDSDVWMTYGDYTQLVPTPGHCSYQLPDEVIKNNAFRDYPWVSSHLRTYYGWLAHKIKKEDCMHEGKFYPFVSDLVIMLPLLEMAGRHSRFIPDILYVWNNESPINEGKVNEGETMRYAQLIRQAQRYQPVLGDIQATSQ